MYIGPECARPAHSHKMSVPNHMNTRRAGWKVRTAGKGTWVIGNLFAEWLRPLSRISRQLATTSRLPQRNMGRTVVLTRSEELYAYANGSNKQNTHSCCHLFWAPLHHVLMWEMGIHGKVVLTSNAAVSAELHHSTPNTSHRSSHL